MKETDFMVEVDPCREGNICKTDYTSISPLSVTSGKIIRHLHRRTGHYLEKHICTPKPRMSSWSQALLSVSLNVKHLLKMAQRRLIHSLPQFTRFFPLISLNFESGLRVANRMPKEEGLRRMKKKKGAGMTATVIKYKFNILQNRILARNIYCT